MVSDFFRRRSNIEFSPKTRYKEGSSLFFETGLFRRVNLKSTCKLSHEKQCPFSMMQKHCSNYFCARQKTSLVVMLNIFSCSNSVGHRAEAWPFLCSPHHLDLEILHENWQEKSPWKSHSMWDPQKFITPTIMTFTWAAIIQNAILYLFLFGKGGGQPFPDFVRDSLARQLGEVVLNVVFPAMICPVMSSSLQ